MRRPAGQLLFITFLEEINMAAKGTIYGINGPIVYIAGDSGFQMNEMVYVGEANLVGEVIGLTSERTTIEVYEETTGLKPGEPVTGTGAPVSVTLAPGIITNILMESNVR